MTPLASFDAAGVLRALAESSAKGAVLLLLGGAAALALHRSSAAVRHAVWTAAIVGALLVAPLGLLLPAVRVHPSGALAGALARFTYSPGPRGGAAPDGSVDAPDHSAAAPGSAQAAVPSLDASSMQSALLAVWAAGALILSGSFLVAGVRLARIARHAGAGSDPRADRLAFSAAQQLGVPPARVRLRWTAREFTPMTWGLRRPVVILPDACKSWDDERLGQALVHELGHVQRWDVLTQAAGSAACALYWFNPLVWLAARQMLVERERACDDLVLRSGARPSAYAHGLLEIARSLGARWTAAHVSPAMARRSQISGRLLAVLDPARPRHGLGRRAALAAAIGAAVVILAVAVLQPVPAILAAASPEPQTARAGPAAMGAEDAGAIAAVYEEWKSAVARRDAAAVSLFYTQDGTVVEPGRPPVNGRQAVADLYRAYFALGVASVDIRTQELYPVGDMICEIGSSDAFGAGGDVLSSSRYMTLWKREDGQWRVHRDYFSQ